MSPKEAVQAVEAAAKAWGRGRGEWPRKSLEQRVAAVEKLVEKLKERRSEIVSVLQWEICKNDADAAKEFDRTMDFIGVLISAARGFDSTGMACHEGVHALLKRSPIGVMMNLGPSNYPFNETYATLIPAILIGRFCGDEGSEHWWPCAFPHHGGLCRVLPSRRREFCLWPGTRHHASVHGDRAGGRLRIHRLIEGSRRLGKGPSAATSFEEPAVLGCEEPGHCDAGCRLGRGSEGVRGW